jgi:hypothetical protein
MSTNASRAKEAEKGNYCIWTQRLPKEVTPSGQPSFVI